MRLRLIATLAGLLLVSSPTAAMAFDTARPPQLVATESGVEVDPILSVGDTIGGYQMTGIPDGLGAFAPEGDDDDDGALEVLMNHELTGSEPAGVSARVTQLTLDTESRSVLDAAYPIDGTEGFLRFCSSNLTEIGGRALYFTGEESTSAGSLTPDPSDGFGRGGSSIVLDGETGAWTETRHFGLFQHENNLPVTGLKQAVVLLSEDAPSGNPSQLYAYIAPSFRRAIAGTGGSLHVWRADPGQGQDANPSSNDIAEGETLSGEFVPVSQAENANAATLETAVQGKGAFDFIRLEDVAQSQTRDKTAYMADTGALGSESVRGRMYEIEFSKSDPTQASIELFLDGDAHAGSSDPVEMVNPDNIDTSKGSIVIQEDRNSEHRDATVEGGYGRVLVYDLSTDSLRAVARVNTPATLRPGEWESSGVINAEAWLGDDMWLLDVQAHSQTAPQPGPGLVPDSSSGEDGQLLAIEIPGS
jgi:hypothetical protein